MKASNYRVVPLNSEVAATARRAAETGIPDHVYVTADSPTGYPCRHCLRWAQPGEQMVLFPFASIAPGRPYSETGPIFVHAQPCPVYEANGQYPPDFREGRVIRAYDAQQDMIDAEVVGDRDPETIIEKLLANPATAFLQARSVSRGCYTFALERV